VLQTLFISLMVAGIAWAGPAAGFLAEAKRHHGESGEKAASFLVEHMPAKDQQALTADFLTNNLDLAFRARAEFPMVCAAGSDEVAAVNVTARYRMPDAGAGMARLGVRLWDENGGKRLVAIFMGAKDAAHNRNGGAAEKSAKSRSS
jgi:hypothetical protein